MKRIICLVKKSAGLNRKCSGLMIYRKIIAFILSGVLVLSSAAAAAEASTGVNVRATAGNSPAALAEGTSASSPGSAGSVPAADINKMASALNKLNILKGDNGDYMLDEKLKRYQAAIFIIRMLGKENYVLQNQNQFKYTRFIDVVSGKPYAPYVGYCTLSNILAGTTASTFEPENTLTEKQFLKMALCALGYEYGADFNWSNVYQKAYAVGIVTDPSYAGRVQDNTDYLRSDAVAVIFRALNVSKKGAQVKFINTLVDEGAFTRELVAASGILGDDKATEIDIVTALAPNSIEVNLNENIIQVNPADISIFDSLVPANLLAVQTVAFRDDRIQIITAPQTPDRTYVINIKSVTDASGNVSGKLESTFKGYVPQQVASDYFRIMKVEQPSANLVNVYFTHPVSESAETSAYYELTRNGAAYISGSSNITVKKLQSFDNAVSIYLKNALLTPGQLYGVKISGKLASSYGVKLGEGAGDSKEFVATAAESGEFAVSSVQAWTSTSVRIAFSREVDPAWAEERLNYTVADKNGRQLEVIKAVVGGTSGAAGREVMLNLASSLESTRQYDLKIKFIPDIYSESIIKEKTYSFSGTYPVNTDLVLKQVVSEYNNSVVLIFNKALDVSSASNAANYTIGGISDTTFNVVPKKAYYSEKYGVYSVKLFLPEGRTFASSQKYVVYVNSVKDSLGSNQATFFRSEFTGGSSSLVKPRMADAVTVSKNAVKLLFNIEIAFDINNISTANYSLEYVENGELIKIAPIGVTYVDANTIVLHFDSLDASLSYQLRFKSITDYSGVYTRTSEDGDTSIAVRFGK